MRQVRVSGQPSRRAERGPAYWYREQQRFMAEHGTTAGGYVLHAAALYASRGQEFTPEALAQTLSIWQADQAALEKLAGQAARGRWDRRSK